MAICIKKLFLNLVAALSDLNKRKGLINIFVRAIYLYDDRFTLILNGSGQPFVIDDILLDEIEAAFDDETSDIDECSPLVADASAMKER